MMGIGSSKIHVVERSPDEPDTALLLAELKPCLNPDKRYKTFVYFEAKNALETFDVLSDKGFPSFLIIKHACSKVVALAIENNHQETADRCEKVIDELINKKLVYPKFI